MKKVPPKKALFAYNPMSGNRFVAQNLDFLVQVFQKEGYRLELYRIAQEEELLEGIANTKVDLIIGAGGDGTISQVIASMHHFGVDLPFLALGTGTSNNFTRNIESTRAITSPEQAEQVIWQALSGKVAQYDIGMVNQQRVFLTSLAGGNFIDTSFETDKSLKYVLGTLAYYIKPLTELSNIRSYPIQVIVDGVAYQERITIFLILNGNSVGNFDQLIQDANMRDGEMELVLIKEGTTKENISLFRSIIWGEDISSHSNIMVLKGKHFVIRCDEEMPIALDGEKGPSLPLDVQVIHQAVSVHVADSKKEERSL